MSGLPAAARSTGRASVASPSPRGIAGPGGPRVPGGPTRPGRPGGPGGPGGPRGSGSVYRGRGRRPKWGRIILVLGVGLLVLALVAGGGAALWYRSVSANIDRTDPFAGITSRPEKVVDGALNLLVLGSDSRDPESKAKPGEWRTDTMIVAHIPSGGDKVYLISIPRDLKIHIPRSPTNPKLGNTEAKINSAFAWGGLPLAVQAIEGYSGLRMDHVVLIDFGGFKQVVDALGGIDMPIDQSIESIHPPKRKFTKGTMHLDGAAALDYVRQRYQYADGDFARMRHQQQFMRAVLDKAASGGTLSNPRRISAFARATAEAVTVDQDLSLLNLALEFRKVRSEDLVFYVSPNRGSERINGEDVIVPDPVKGPALYTALKNDKAADWFAANAAPTATTK